MRENADRGDEDGRTTGNSVIVFLITFQSISEYHQDVSRVLGYNKLNTSSWPPCQKY